MDFVNVFLRIKPDCSKNSCLKVVNKCPAIVHVLDRPQSYSFDNIFEEDVKQEEVYNNSVKPLVNLVIKGFNCTVFAYGQTGSGKTYTVGTESQVNEKDIGLIDRALEDFFNNSSDLEIAVSFVEIYNDKVYDLLKVDTQPPLIVKGGKIHGFSKEKVCSKYEAKHFLNLGNKNRHTAETKLNANSSRSHAIFTIYHTSRCDENQISAKLNLVDLAGSESVKKTGNQGNTFQEGVNINKGLFYIGQVITALSLNKFVNYRQSIITTILQDSLNRNNYVTLIACVNPNSDDVHETLQTLEFAQRVKKIKNKPEVNEIFNEYKLNNPMAFANLKTPLKRSILTPHKNFSQQKQVVGLNCIKESDNDFDGSSLTSSSISNSELSAQNSSNLSPVIRKYMNKVENTLMSKIGDVLQNQLSKMIKTEVALQTVRLARATSSPLGDENLTQIKKVLNYDSPLIDEKNENEFKMPFLPKTKQKTIQNTSSISPIVSEASRRRSVRLSLKRNLPEDSNSEKRKSDDFAVPLLPTPRLKANRNTNETKITRTRSSRLSERQECDSATEKQTVRRSTRLSMRQSVTNDLNSTLVHRLPKKYEAEFVSSPPKKALKMANQRENLSKEYEEKFGISSPKRRKVSRVQALKDEAKSSQLSPKSNHRFQVLDVLNRGSLKDVEKLHTVGTKTAEQILLQRKLNGKFHCVNDLVKIPGWSKKRLDRFLTQNFLYK